MDVKTPARRRLPQPTLHLPPGAAWLARETYGRMDLITRDDVVLDLGACVGTFAARAAELEVRAVIAVEPDPFSFRWLEVNTLLYPRVTRVNAAVARWGLGSVELWRDPSNAHLAMHSTAAPRRDYRPVRVPTVSLASLVRVHRPTVVKVDVEGAEYDLDLARTLGLAQSVRLVWLEFTLDRPEFREAAPVLWQGMLDAGFTTANKPIPADRTFGRVTRWTR